MHGSEGLKNMDVKYYCGLFTVDVSIGKQFISRAFPRIEADLCEEIENEYSMEETQMALRGMGSYKAPGPNGYYAIFFKRSWHLTRTDVHSFLKGILEGGEIPEGAAEALLLLRPKETKPSTMRGFRPLSLCNTVYKLASKRIVNRLMEVWKGLIAPY